MSITSTIKRSREIYIISLLLTFEFIFVFLLVGTRISARSSDVKYFFELIHGENQEILLSVQVYPEENFYLEYTNSRDLNPIIDVFRVGKAGYFYLIEERYPWYGVGQECHPSREIYFEDGMVVVKIHQEMKKLSLRVAYTVNQVIRINKNTYQLNQFAESGDPLDILITVKGG